MRTIMNIPLSFTTTLPPLSSENPARYFQAAGLGNPLFYALAAVGCALLENCTALDQLAQSPFFAHGSWLISKSFHRAYGWLLYTGPKALIIAIACAFFFVFLAASCSTRTQGQLQGWKKPALLAFLSIALVPLLVSGLKEINGVHIPADLLPYGGEYPHVGWLTQLLAHGWTTGGRAFPAGHASGGFALMSLYYLPLSPQRKKALFLAGLAAGWLMGLYQMARGEHFLSHTLTTMFLALTLISFLGGRMKIPPAPPTAVKKNSVPKA